ncbi:light-regulated signal transduction histidine kinase (bacteriophytochrome) [Neorhizobium galegae]|uniref:HWE histidine kinase domain-containing protein n=1 Tax=Neorhizobium galegae TaxID=399 RepID=UPI001AE7865C|nr:HWE histidine kinase domain-containing protein [Neorhizobium galegae]MBP2549522.1 light-regulated signal transduction histidine kinase (bacteriophytochrome) [Neorhizobium galegae]
MPHNSQVDLTNCDREPIHTPGSIQPYGCLLVTDMSGGTVLRHSANLPAMLGLTGVINGARLDEVVGDEVAHTLRNALATTDDPARPALRMAVPLPAGAFDVSVHRLNDMAIIEFEPASAHSDQPLENARMLISRIRAISGIDELVEKSARLVFAMLGYDRVMIYRFEHDGAGKVVSEYKRRDLESFKGQYFPASDIPKQARTLYLKNTIRIISDASGTRVPVLPELDDTAAPLDLSFAHLRSVSPIHCEYLRNMGVAASMSISVIIDGELWGLIACHHYAPKSLAMSQRIAAEMFGEFFSLHLSALKQKQILDTANNARKSLDRFLQSASHTVEVAGFLRQSLNEFSKIMPCDGIGLWLDGIWTGHGAVPPQDAIAGLGDFVASVSGGRIWGTDQLSLHLPQAIDYASDVSGLLAIPLSQRPRDYLFFFRRELVQMLDWAGNPDKSYTTGPMGDRLTPRKSFALWKETVHLKSQRWTESEREIAEAIRSVLVEVVLHHNELLADERGKADVRQRMLNEELNHRVKNILAVIKALVGHPVQEGRLISDYVATLKGRIQALAFAHDQVVRGGDGGALKDLLEAELKPYRDGDRQVSLRGPHVWLDSRGFSVMALVLHEMSTNAAKYGALSANGGRLDITWSRNEDGSYGLNWAEEGGPLVHAPKRAGFGTVLIERSIPYELGGESRVDYRPSGLHAHFLIPAKHIHGSDGPTVDQEVELDAASASEIAALLGDLELLLVEDQMLVAADVETLLLDHGISKVTTAPSAAEALRQLKSFTPHVAILDVNLGSGTSLPIAEELVRRDVPFIFATGYSDQSVIPASFDAPVVRKPYEATALIGAVIRVLAAREPVPQN